MRTAGPTKKALKMFIVLVTQQTCSDGPFGGDGTHVSNNARPTWRPSWRTSSGHQQLLHTVFRHSEAEMRMTNEVERRPKARAV